MGRLAEARGGEETGAHQPPLLRNQVIPEQHRGIRKPYLDTYFCWYEILYNFDPDMACFKEMGLGDIQQKKTEINT